MHDGTNSTHHEMSVPSQCGLRISPDWPDGRITLAKQAHSPGAQICLVNESDRAGTHAVYAMPFIGHCAHG